MEENLPRPVNSRQIPLKAIVGLGNPGRDYESTRHNLGFIVVDRLAGNQRFSAGTGKYYYCRANFSGGQIVLLKPTTYMNRAGLAVADYARANDLKPEEVLVIADDFNLPLGQIRLRQSGSDGGHKGIASIIYHLESDNFPRLRLGIGPVPVGIPAERYVLERFTAQELTVVEQMTGSAAQAVQLWIERGFEISAAQFNRAIDEN